MTVKVVFKFDVDNLPGFDDPTDPRCRNNIQDTFRRMLYNIQEAMTTELSKPAISDEAMNCYKVEAELIRRILSGMKVLEIIENPGPP